MTGPKGNSEFCFPETHIVVEGKQNSLFPAGPVITSQLKTRKKLQRNRLLYASWLTNLLRFQGAWPDHVRVKSSCCCFPGELPVVSFVRPTEFVRFDTWQVILTNLITGKIYAVKPPVSNLAPKISSLYVGLVTRDVTYESLHHIGSNVCLIGSECLPHVYFCEKLNSRKILILPIEKFQSLVLCTRLVNILLNNPEAVHNRNTSRCNNFVIPQYRLWMGQRAFYFWGPREWNGLPVNIKNTKEIDIFKWTLFKICSIWSNFGYILNDFEYIFNLILNQFLKISFLFF